MEIDIFEVLGAGCARINIYQISVNNCEYFKKVRSDRCKPTPACRLISTRCVDVIASIRMLQVASVIMLITARKKI